MSRYSKKPETAVRSDTNNAKSKLRSVGYVKESSVDEESGEESQGGSER